MTPAFPPVERLRDADTWNRPGRRVLIIKPSAIGDVVHALPFLSLMRRKWPTARISWLITPGCAGLIEGHPQVDEMIVFDRRRFGRAYRSPAAAAEFLRFIAGLRGKFDLVVDLQGLFRSAFLARATGAPTRIGMAYAREGAPAFYTHSVPAGDPERHAIERYLDVAEAMGLGRGPAEFVFNTRDEDRQAIINITGPAPYAVLLPGTNWLTKRWPGQHYRQVADRLREAHGLRVIVAGGPNDEYLAREINADLSLCGKTTLRQTTALLESAALVIGNDTGPLHIAAALGTPMVAIYGPTSPLRTGPYRRSLSVIRLDLPCSPCLSRRCSHTSCMHWLQADPVLAHAVEQMRAGPIHARLQQA